ncbi:rhodanese-like domain-containing protein 8, chloroplastic isoform X4 [Hibiscus syriacus]|uniref:rhodanese-like domain-containing protein 8, chloroplastic isoform X4 n=1 Tax=Hibiscus syriacus TaxID=106335 RepID=UPI0019244E87|nr:rhodanese-like domain-containing protein 8, chloroplastic isoform X4 [Hibiscus syriacus]
MGGWSAHCLSIPHSLILGHYSKSLSKAAAHPHYFCFHYCLPIKSRKDPCAISIRFCASTSESHNVDEIRQAEPETDDFVVVNFYRFVFIKEPQHEVSKHLTFLKGLDIHGRIYINEQGINAQYSGPSKHAFAYVEWLKEDQKFSDILVQTSPSDGHAFPKLKLRYKPSLVQLEGGISHLPLLDPSMRATAIAPSEWRKRLEAANNNDTTSNTNSSSNYILLDVRNGYEWDIGHFHGAHRPDVDCFRSTSFGTSPTQGVASDQLSQVDKEKTDILMYCTGGIRCDVYSTILRCCANCVMDLRGCCCHSCTIAPRRRPVLPGFQRYKKWHVYRDQEIEARAQ